MPPQVRTRASKALKENVDKENRKPKVTKKTKTTRRALADKTNSLSDDNESIEVLDKVTKKVHSISEKKVVKPDTELEKAKPRRQRRLPNRYVDNHVLNNLSNSKDNADIQIPIITKKPQVNVSKNPKKTSEQTVKGTPLVTNTNNTLNSNNDVQIVKATKKPHKAFKDITPLTYKQEMNGLLTVDTLSPFKTPVKNTDSSLIANRPRRICKLPSRFDDHSISPSKFIPVQPCHASTPIVPNKSKTSSENIQNNLKSNITEKMSKSNEKHAKKVCSTATDTHSAKTGTQPLKSAKKVTQKKLDHCIGEKVSPDTNNNRKQTRSVRNRKLITKKNSPVVSSKAAKSNFRQLIDKSNSFRVLEEAQKKNIDIYEFTFDPNEEPTPKKKKRKRVVKKKPIQPKKQFLYKNNYDNNISKTLTALKTAVSKNSVKSVNVKVVKTPALDNGQKIIQSAQYSVKHAVDSTNERVQNTEVITDLLKPSTSGAVNSFAIAANYSPVYEDNANAANYSPVYEDNALGANCSPVYEDNIDFNHTAVDVNYSPVNAADHTRTDNVTESKTQEQLHKDPLNLLDDLSFFDEQPVACSSVNVSGKHPLASPWRVEFESLPIKWHVNSYVKPNMTPAVECSFISSEDNVKKQHVYTDMVALSNDTLPHIVDNEPNYKQTSIMSFIKEVAEKQARKKLHKSPRKVNSIFEDITNTTNYSIHTPKKNVKYTSEDKNSRKKDTSNSSSNVSSDKDYTGENRKRKNNEEINAIPAKSPRRQKDKDCTYFGFDDTGNQDENVSPVKNTKKHNLRSLRPRTRTVLNELNGQNGPTRPNLPLAAKTNAILSSEAVNKVYEDLKSAADAPLFKEQTVNNIETTNIDKSHVVVNDNDESQSVHLFEDIDVVHHLKPTRKSYGKAKKVAFRQRDSSDSDTYPDTAAAVEQESIDEDDLFDLTFHIPEVKEKKPTKKRTTKKKLMSKKEEKEAEAWAAGFNSMCEDIEEFPLLVE
ncbi:hypothetical protein K1T71_010912 [Dendrolimus kikuchii]|uniref:Uncharacterized protein n=1 Tax=Dendrolimus kikuchii TaxID=765133 RepID=A0ACC1CQ69_9NEOP|nr:hypothetical protein K1T71_010912 [Dendrolimus kikuchii]